MRHRRHCHTACRDRRDPISRAVGIFLVAIGLFAGMKALAGDHRPSREGVLDEDLIAYRNTPATGAIAELQKRLDRGEAQLAFDPAYGYLLSLLRELKVPVSSQILVASKTSANRDWISPTNPRALYFNPTCSIAFVPSAPWIQLAAWDSKLGVVFYTIEQKAALRPKFVRDDRCLECHVSAKTLDVPGLLNRSFRAESDGAVDLLSGILVHHRTPLADRWGGYYVTGTLGSQTHRGNRFGHDATNEPTSNSTDTANITGLNAFLDTCKYPEPGSDIVALMVRDHEVHGLNLLTRLASDAAQVSTENIGNVYPTVEAVLRYFLFVDEVRLQEPIGGTSGFKQWFEGQGPKDKQGRSLCQFDLRERLFKYPCSFLIYSPAFDGLPYSVRKLFYHRLWEVLTGEDKSTEFAGLFPEQRQAILEILVATKKQLPISWQF